MRVIVLLLLVTQSAFGFEFEGGTIEIPSNFNGPIYRHMDGQGTVYGFKKTHKDGKTGTLLQLTVFEPGQKFPELSRQELKEGASNYLLQLLSGVERRRKMFVKSNVEFVEISSVPTAKITWTGSEYSRKMEGVMYCYIHNSKVIGLHTQDFIEYKGKYLSQAVQAFENIKINR